VSPYHFSILKRHSPCLSPTSSTSTSQYASSPLPFLVGLASLSALGVVFIVLTLYPLQYTYDNGWKYEFWLKSEKRIVYCKSTLLATRRVSTDAPGLAIHGGPMNGEFRMVWRRSERNVDWLNNRSPELPDLCCSGGMSLLLSEITHS
jgi:hypothetical protein